LEIYQLQNYQIIFSVLSAVILFLYGLSSFSLELKNAAGAKLKSLIATLTSNRFNSFLLGALFTTLIQSSTAVTSLTISLVNSGLLTFFGAMGIILGSSLGTTTTAFLVSLKLTGLGPIFIVLGGILSVLPIKFKVFGKALFYFGFIFFALDLIGSSLGPVRTDPSVKSLLLLTDNTYLGILIGILVTIVLQSSSVVTGLAVIFVQQGLMMPENAVPIVLGANIGTTTTALFASLNMSPIAKKVALSNTIINCMGVILLIPIIDQFTAWVVKFSEQPDMVVVISHITFNLILVSFFMIFLNQFVTFMNKVFKENSKP